LIQSATDDPVTPVIRTTVCRVDGALNIHMRKTTLFVAAVAALVLITIGTWFGVRTFIPTRALAGSTDQPSVMMTGAKGLPTSHYDDYEIVVY
jgi:hypothetical protein